MKSTQSRWPIAAIILALIVGAIVPSCRKPHTARIVLGVSALRISLPVFVAADSGLFREQGLDVELRTYNTAQPMVDDVSLGHLDAAGFAAYPIVFMSSRRAQRPLRVATSLIEDHDHRLSYVLAHTGANLRFPADARGKRIGILPTVAYRRWLIAILQTVGLSADDFTIVPVEPGLQAQTLRDGGVDFLFTNDPMATAIIQNHIGEIVDDGPPCSARLGEPFSFGAFVLSGAFSEARASDATRLIAAIDRAIESVRNDPAGARRAMAHYIRPEERPFIEHYPASRYLSSDDATPALLAGEIMRAHTLGILDHEPNVRAWSPPPRP